MKTQTKKLVLRTSTIRTLSDDQLAGANGGLKLYSVDCSTGLNSGAKSCVVISVPA